jgi:hypothetical protein
MPVLLVDDSDENQIGPSGPELIDVDEFAGLNDPKFTTPPTGSMTGVSNQPKTVEVSMEISAPDPLYELIKIYDDDDSPEVSLGTPVHIEEEMGHEKTSYPLPKVQTQEVP